ncbi:MAG: hypothetical protein WC107_05325 [Patescibacteria group bacterium]
MENTIPAQILFLADLVIYFLIILVHITKRNISIVYVYAAQSLMITFLMVYSASVNHSYALWILAALIFGLKVAAAPIFFLRQIKKQTLQSMTSSYLGLPLTLIGIAVLTMVTHSRFFAALATLSPANENALMISIAAMFISLFIIINRKGALSQMIGILSLENAIVAFAFAAGLEQGLGLELGIIFDICAWIVIATVFVTMIYKKFHTLDVSVMTKLKG